MNDEWVDAYPTVATHDFMHEGQFDHFPMIINVDPHLIQGKHHFRYFRIWSEAPIFHFNYKIMLEC